jgi:hypothetical protein
MDRRARRSRRRVGSVYRRYLSRLSTGCGLGAPASGPDAPPRSRIRAASALFAAHTSCMFFTTDALAPEADQAQPADRDELHKIVLELAEDLARGVGPA